MIRKGEELGLGNVSGQNKTNIKSSSFKYLEEISKKPTNILPIKKQEIFWKMCNAK